MTIMKSTIYSTRTRAAAFKGALYKSNVSLSILCLIIVTLWNTNSVKAAPAKLDSLDSTFPLDLQPPIFEATVSASSPSQPKGDNGRTTIDSYGNPIENLQPVETPDGRKVVSAQGLQFEIPNYASGITELKKPADDLLPPFVGEFSNDFDISSSTRNNLEDVGQSNDDKRGIRIINNKNNDRVKADDSQELVDTFLTSDASLNDQQRDLLRYKRQLQHTTTTDTNNNNNNNFNVNLKQPFKTQNNITNTNTNKNTNNLKIANTVTRTLPVTNHKRLERKITNFTTSTPSSNFANSLSSLERKQSEKLNSLNFISNKNISSSPSSKSSHQYHRSIHSPSSKTKLSAHSTPLSNGNFNYPNVPSDTSIIDRIVFKYKKPLPTLDPIAVALPNASPESLSSNPDPTSSDETTTVDVESVPLVEVNAQPTALMFKGLPDYILELNDPDIGGPVDYEPSKDKRGLNVIAWDLLPPWENEETADKSVSHSNKVSVTTGHNLNAHQASQESSHTAQRHQFAFRNSVETTTSPNYTKNRGGVFYSSTTAATTPKTTTTKRSTTPRTTTTTVRPTTTTTRRTTTPRTTMTTTTTTTPEPDSSEFFKLEAGDSYTLPPWLQDIDDPDLDVAVAYNVPENIKEYNDTIDRDLLPPLEPYTDLNNLHVTPPPDLKTSTTTARTTTKRIKTTTTPRTTTTKRPAPSTAQPHWIRAKATSAKPTIATFNNQFTSFSSSISSNNFAHRTASTTTTTTVKPKSSINLHNRQLSSNNPQTDKIGSSTAISSSEEVKPKPKNPFLPTFDDGKYKPQSTTRRATTTTTTTTTTPAPEIIEKNPFEPTIPPWLKDFDYPDVGPGVPFIYDPNEDENPVDKNILPPSKTDDSDKTNLPSSTSPFLNSQTPQGFTNKFTSSSIPLTSASSSSIPSIVTVIPLPSTQTNRDDDSTFTRLPLVLTPPQSTSAEGTVIAEKSDEISKHTSSTFNKNFAAPFDPANSITTANVATEGDQKKVPLSADRESFPPFNTLPSKTTFSKSEDGKVITNNVFLSGSPGSTSAAKPVGSSQAVNNPDRNALTTQPATGSAFTKSSETSGVFKPFATASTAASGFVTASSSTSDGSKYTGRFGGPPGVLAPQDTTNTGSFSKPLLTPSSATPSTATNNKDKFSGSFGGPPGVLKPFDNVKNR